MADEFEKKAENLITSDGEAFHDPFLDGNEKIEKRIQKYNEKDSWANYAEIMAAIEKRIKEDGHFILPTITDEQDNTSFTLPMMEDEDGKMWNVAFTSMEEYKKGEQGSAISHFIDSTLKLCLDNPSEGFILNPYGASVKLKKEYIDRILRLAGDEDSVIPEGPFTEEMLQDGSILKKAAKIYNKFPLDDSKEKLASILKESYVWIPCDMTLSDADYENWRNIVNDAERHGTISSSARRELKDKNVISLIPHLNQSGIYYSLPVFSSAGEMRAYGNRYSKIKMPFHGVMDLIKRSDKAILGVTVNHGSIILERDALDGTQLKDIVRERQKKGRRHDLFTRILRKG